MFSGIGFVEMVVIGIVAVLLFGQRLPEVARNVGRGYRELRKSLTDIKSSIDLGDEDGDAPSFRRANSSNRTFDPVDDIDEPTAPKLAPPDPDDG